MQIPKTDQVNTKRKHYRYISISSYRIQGKKDLHGTKKVISYRSTYLSKYIATMNIFTLNIVAADMWRVTEHSQYVRHSSKLFT